MHKIGTEHDPEDEGPIVGKGEEIKRKEYKPPDERFHDHAPKQQQAAESSQGRSPHTGLSEDGQTLVG